MSKAILTPSLCRAARALLDWDQGRLAEEAKVSKSVVARFELGTGNVHANRIAAMQDAFERAGLALIPENGGGLGLRFKLPG